MLTILEQHELGGEIVCPHCGNEIGQYYGQGGESNIENDACVFCDCDLGYDDEGTKKWCIDCERRCDGKKYIRRRNDYADRVDYETKLRKEEWV